jgi:D-alanyl-D-alanine carboxypeptidase
MPPPLDLPALETLFATTYTPTEPGAAVLIAQDGIPLFRQGYGMANLELGFPITPEMVFRIGSVTKQFTAVSILMLVEQGKLALSDPLEKFLPDYPVHGHTITVEHLLTHTSGIKSYTGMKDFEQRASLDLTPAEMVDYFKNQPMDFAPGRRWSYNNSAYFLLGVIIEKVSGLTYAGFLQQHIFDPLGMQHTFYDDPRRVIPNRASGYTKDKDVIVNDRYLSMTQPFSAGALLSTIDDLLLWDEALYTEKLLPQAALQKALTPYHLVDGKEEHYGYGWGLHTFQGQPWIEHGGGINGFLCQAIRLPAQHLYIVVLSNTTAPKLGPSEVASRAAAIALGSPLPTFEPVELPAASLEAVAGEYVQLAGNHFSVSVVDGKLKLAAEGWPEILVHPVAEDCYMGDPFGSSQLRILRDPHGAVTAMELVNIFGEADFKSTLIPDPSPKESRE